MITMLLQLESIGLIIGVYALTIVISFFVGAVCLWLALKIFKYNSSPKEILKTAFFNMLAGLLSIIPIFGYVIAAFIQIYIINIRHTEDFVKAFLVWLIAGLIPIGINILISVTLIGSMALF